MCSYTLKIYIHSIISHNSGSILFLRIAYLQMKSLNLLWLSITWPHHLNNTITFTILWTKGSRAQTIKYRFFELSLRPYYKLCECLVSIFVTFNTSSTTSCISTVISCKSTVYTCNRPGDITRPHFSGHNVAGDHIIL